METLRSTNRRYDVDWLRNLAFVLLILYHVGMYYVFDWYWHIKSEHQSEWLQNVMIWSNQWRMSLLFFVSGMTLALISAKYSALKLLKTRFLRLYIPLVFGMLVIIPPQLYWELIYDGAYSGSFLSFYAEYVNLETTLARYKHTPIGLITWNHLWYLAYLLLYTVVFLGVRPALNSMTTSRFFHRFGTQSLIFFGFFSLMLAFVILEPRFGTTYAFFDDWFNHAKYLSVMICGYLFVNIPRAWQWVIDKRLRLLGIACLTIGLILLERNAVFPSVTKMLSDPIIGNFVFNIVIVANLWCWLLTMVGYAGRYLNRESKLLHYANNAVLPWYMLHQTFIILFAVWLVQFNLSVWLEIILLIVLTIIGCIFGYELIKRLKPLRFVFGMKITRLNE
jgi:hypothetical protein